MQKRPASTAVAVLALLALVLATVVPASVTAAPSEMKASEPSTEGAKEVNGKVIDCDIGNAGRVAAATVRMYEEWIVPGPNNTSSVQLKWLRDRTAKANGEWLDVILRWNYTFIASHDDWTADNRAVGRIDNETYDKAQTTIAAEDVCLNPKPLVQGKFQQQGTGAKLALAVEQFTAFYEDKGVTLNNTKVANGDFSFRAEPGTYTLKARYPCHYDASAKITVSPPSGQGIGTTVDAGILELAKIGDPCVKLFGQVKDKDTNIRIAGRANVSALDDESHFTSNVSTDASAFYFLDLTRGQVKLVAKAPGYFDKELWVTIPKGVLNQRQDIVMTPIGPGAHEISGYVKNGGGPVPGARVDLYDDRGNANADSRYSTFTISGSNGWYKFMVPSVVNSSFSLIASKDGHLNNSPLVVPGGGNRLNQNITLGNLPSGASLLGTVFARDAKGVPTPLAGARATVYDTMHLKSFTNVSDSSGAVQFPALYAGKFFVSVDHPQHQSNGTMASLAGGQQGYIEVVLEDHVRDLYNSSYVFARNMSNNSNLYNVSNFMLYRNVTLEHDNVSVRASLDLSFGRGPYGYIINDWMISAAEYQEWLAFRKPKWEGDAKSEDFFTVNKTAYDRKAASPISAVNNTGDVLLRAPMKFMLDMNFNTTKLKNGSLYELLTNTTYDTFTTNYTGLVHVPSNYERTNTNSPFDLQNHTRVVVDPPNGSGRAEVKFTFQSSGIPTPVAKVWAWNDGTHTAERGAYVKPSTDAKVFLVANSTKLIFSGEDSKDAIGDILRYKWDFNGTLNRTTDWISNETSPHYYNETASNLSAGNNYTVLMWVMNRGLKTNETNISVIVDHEAPVAIINVTSDKDVHVNNGTGPSNAWKMVWANESQSIAFNASYSYDNTTLQKEAKDRNGTIRIYQWDWCDNITNKKNCSSTQDGASLTHAFKVNGTYNVTLNVTDVVGHWTKTNITVVVNDTTKPEVFIEMWELKGLNFTADKNITDSKQGKENKTYSFRVGKNSRDPNFGTIVKWNWQVASPSGKFYVNESGTIQDPAHAKEWASVPWQNSTFNATGVWTVSLNMTDARDNWKNETFRVTIAQQPRPDLVFNTPSGGKEKLNFSVPVDKIKTGMDVTVSANLSNNKGVGGAANATEVVVKLFVDEKEVGSWSPEGGKLKAPEKGPTYANVSIVWKIGLFEGSGPRKLKLVAEASGENGGEHPTAKEDSKVEREVNVSLGDIPLALMWIAGIGVVLGLGGTYVMWRYKRGPFSEEARTLRKLKKEEKEREEEEEEEAKAAKAKDKGAKKADEDEEEEEDEK
jgi:hypothetical protein